MVWAITIGLKDNILVSQRQQDFIINQNEAYKLISEDASRIAKRLREMPDYDQEMNALWREINRLDRRLSEIK
jgi:hypothetical protein